MLWILLVGVGVFNMGIVTFQPFRPRTVMKIYIRADGSIDPPLASIKTVDNITYTFTDNIIGSIIVMRNHTVIDGAGFTVYCNGEPGFTLRYVINVTVTNAEVTAYQFGIFLEGSDNNAICGNTITDGSVGIRLDNSSSFNTVSGNTITNNGGCGISLVDSNRNTVSGNNSTNNTWGIVLSDSSSNTVGGNAIANNDYGVWLVDSSSNNKVSGNTIATNNLDGIRLSSSFHNTVSGNTIANNNYGALIDYSPYNWLYHNRFINNTHQAYFYMPEHSPGNTWDDGYPSGGNYWSDYEEKYPNATELDDSGLWDTPYVINEDNVDNYPIIPEFPALILLPLSC